LANGTLGPVWQKSLKELERCKWLSVSETGGEFRITRGPRMLQFLQKATGGRMTANDTREEEGRRLLDEALRAGSFDRSGGTETSG
jgi:hypothetical protein